jgi:hypothetical protein
MEGDIDTNFPPKNKKTPLFGGVFKRGFHPLFTLKGGGWA